MSVQVTAPAPRTTQTLSHDPTGIVRQVHAGPDLLQFQDVLPDGTPGPVSGADDLSVVETTEAGCDARAFTAIVNDSFDNVLVLRADGPVPSPGPDANPDAGDGNSSSDRFEDANNAITLEFAA